jgi:hypothetical protein
MEDSIDVLYILHAVVANSMKNALGRTDLPRMVGYEDTPPPPALAYYLR